MSELANVMGAARSHDTLRRVLGSREPCKVLDAAAGQGAVAEYLHGLGWEVHCADVLPDAFKLPDIPIQQVNLNRDLPYGDDEFDAVVCANAVHRLFNPAGAMREFHRILRPGGRLYLNFNNFASIETRVRFLLFGSIETREAEAEQGVNPLANPEADVRNRIMFLQLAQYIEAAGFQIVEVSKAPPVYARWWHGAVAWLVGLLSGFASPAKRKANRLDVVNGDAILRGGHYALLEAVKSKGGEDAPL
jgi:SAM-dependent methyltransferase